MCGNFSKITKAKIKLIFNLACFLVFSIFRNRKGAKTKYKLI